MRVWIDQRACVGNGICEELSPELFVMVDGDVAHVRDRGRLLPSGPAGAATVPPQHVDAVVQAAEECPAGCIYLEE